MEPSISVALATYNGEKYLREQLASIASQSSLPNELVVGDDGSTDSTMEIIQEFAKTAPFPVLVTSNSNNLGYASNFLETASRCRFDWIAFCDQDDVWLNHKLKRVRDAITSAQVQDLVLVVHQARVVDSELNPIRPAAYLPRTPASAYTRRREHKCHWFSLGMAQVVHRHIFHHIEWKTRPCFLRSNGRYTQIGHDYWTCLIANAIGSTYYIDDVCLDYRRHFDAVTPIDEITKNKPSLRFSRPTDGPAYRSKKSATISDYLAKISESVPAAYQTMLLELANDYRKHAKVCTNRDKIWNDPPGLVKFKLCLENLKIGGYTSSNNYGSSPRSLVRDVLKIFSV